MIFELRDCFLALLAQILDGKSRMENYFFIISLLLISWQQVTHFLKIGKYSLKINKNETKLSSLSFEKRREEEKKGKKKSHFNNSQHFLNEVKECLTLRGVLLQSSHRVLGGQNGHDHLLYLHILQSLSDILILRYLLELLWRQRKCPKTSKQLTVRRERGGFFGESERRRCGSG